MSQEKPSLQFWTPSLTDQRSLYDALDKAFDYRGDVTIALADGTVRVGYVFNRNVEADEPYIEMFPADRDEKVRILYRDIAGLHFSGTDTAAGKSWAAWLAKHKATPAD